MSYSMKKLLLTALLCVVALNPAFAKDARIKKVEDWFANLGTGQATFEQKGFDGKIASGNFYIQRPGRLRFEYAGTSPDLAVADGLLIHFYDASQRQTSSAPIGSTLADFFLRSKPNIDGDLQVTNIRNHNGFLSLAIAQIADPAAGQIVLTFKEEPFMLHAWQIIDSQGLSTEVTLHNLKTGMNLDPALFVYKDPAGRGRINR